MELEMKELNMNTVDLVAVIKNLKQKIPTERDALNIYPDKIWDILDVSCQSLCEYIKYSNKLNENNPESHVSDEQIESIKSTFKELLDNFYPMAHTNKPLRELQIIDKESFLRLKDEIRCHQNSCLSNTIEFSEKLIKSVDHLMNP
jgi:hypothetical protein